MANFMQSEITVTFLSDLSYSAVLLDLDGVITATRHLHVEAWKRIFDETFARLKKQNRRNNDPQLTPFDPVSDYVNFVDGKPRLDGIRSLLTSRGIELPEGNETDTLEKMTLRGLAAKKNHFYLELLEREGPHVFPDALKALTLWRKKGIPLAVVSSSRNCVPVLQKAGIESLFQERVDGAVGEALRLRGKPHPDYFLEAAKRLRIPPSQILMIEDAVAGVEAGKRGNFGFVLGIDRSGENRQTLLKHGANAVISSFQELL